MKGLIMNFDRGESMKAPQILLKGRLVKGYTRSLPGSVLYKKFVISGIAALLMIYAPCRNVRAHKEYLIIIRIRLILQYEAARSTTKHTAVR